MAEGMTRRKQTAVKKNGNRGVKVLNQAAFDLVAERAKQIADALMEATRKGHVMSAQLLIQLATGNLYPEQAAAMRPFRKLLLELAAEQQLTGEALDAAEQAEAGNLE